MILIFVAVVLGEVILNQSISPAAPMDAVMGVLSGMVFAVALAVSYTHLRAHET